MGCNLGLLASQEMTEVDKIVLISPEIGCYAEEDKRKNDNSDSSKKLSFEKIKSFIIFKKTLTAAQTILERTFIPILIIYSEDDPFISKRYLNNLAHQRDNIDIVKLESDCHNPLLDKKQKEKTLTLIKESIQK